MTGAVVVEMAFRLILLLLWATWDLPGRGSSAKIAKRVQCAVGRSAHVPKRYKRVAKIERRMRRDGFAQAARHELMKFLLPGAA